MEKEYYTVLETPDGPSGDAHELRTFLTVERARAYRDKLIRQNGDKYFIEWTLQRITRNGRECIDADPAVI